MSVLLANARLANGTNVGIETFGPTAIGQELPFKCVAEFFLKRTFTGWLQD